MKWYEFDSDEREFGRMLEALKQLRSTVWDGNLISKTARDSLDRKGLIVRWNGWQVISQEGMAVLDALGMMNDVRWEPHK